MASSVETLASKEDVISSLHTRQWAVILCPKATISSTSCSPASNRFSSFYDDETLVEKLDEAQKTLQLMFKCHSIEWTMTESEDYKALDYPLLSKLAGFPDLIFQHNQILFLLFYTRMDDKYLDRVVPNAIHLEQLPKIIQELYSNHQVAIVALYRKQSHDSV